MSWAEENGIDIYDPEYDSPRSWSDYKMQKDKVC